MNILKVSENTHSWSSFVHYKLVDDTTNTLLSSLRIHREFFTDKRRRELDFPIEGDIYYLDNFGTESRYRRKGYGRELLNLVKEKMKGKFVYLIVSSSCPYDVTDKQLVEFYNSVGFKVHEKKDYYSYLTWMVLDNR